MEAGIFFSKVHTVDLPINKELFSSILCRQDNRRSIIDHLPPPRDLASPPPSPHRSTDDVRPTWTWSTPTCWRTYSAASRLPPRALAVSRCVCKAWRAAVDHRRLLRADLLPLSLDAVIYDVDHIAAPKLFARRSTARYVTSRLDYLDPDSPPDYAELAGEMADHSNGLVLILSNKVVNPATRQWASLPPLPCACSWPKTRCGRCCHNNRYLVYDPTVSPHYQVFFVPRVPLDAPADMEWPPSSYVMHVYSSKTNCWTERSFVREGDAAGTVEDVTTSHYKSDESMYYSAYWKGSLYLPSRHTDGGFILRYLLTLTHSKIIYITINL
jgi:hypothetical protein